MSTIIENLPEILTAIGSIAALWFTYNQYTKNKLTDYKVEKWKNEEHQKDIKLAQAIATIFGELWELLYGLKATRVFLIQPHPLHDAIYVSATLEVKRQGVSSALDDFKRVKLDSMPKFASRLAKEELITVEDVSSADIENRVKSAMLNDGCNSVIIRRLADETNHWVGNIIIGYSNKLSEIKLDMNEAKSMLDSSAMAIQYDLPEFKAEE